MSTRCSIVIKKDGKCDTLYSHYDGYPSGVGGDLERYLSNPNDNDFENVPDDMELPDFAEGAEIMLSVNLCDEFGYIVSEIPGDIEYMYIIDCDNGILFCYELGLYNDWCSLKLCELIDTDFETDKRKLIFRKTFQNYLV